MNESLTLLIHQVLESPGGSEARSQILASLAELILKGRKVGRSPRGHTLTGVHLEIRDRLYQELLSILEIQIERYDEASIPAQEWGQQWLQQAYRSVLDDACLKRLALDAQRQRSMPELRYHTLTQLVEAVRLSGRLAHPHQGKFLGDFYHLLYEEAVNRTLSYMCCRIDTYDPERGQNQKFMNWVNFRLDRMMFDCRREFSDANVQELPNLNDLEMLTYHLEEESPAVRIHECIATDIDGSFRKTHIRNHPEANFRAIALARFEHQSWEEISAHLQIKISTLSSFFQRCCTKFAPKLQEYL